MVATSHPSIASVEQVASTDAPLKVTGGPQDSIGRSLWFKTDPLDRAFCHSIAQLQLITDSRDQGNEDDECAGVGSWFEISILSTAQDTTPRVKNNAELVWTSHRNNAAMKERSQHFGVVFDRRHDLLNELEIGNVIAVHVCARSVGWINDAYSGRLVAKILKEEIFAPNPWALSVENENLGVYTVTSSKECQVIATDHELHTQIWFTTPPLDENIVANIEQVQLSTNAHNQGYADNPESGSWTWFDIVVLSSPTDTKPKVLKDGRSLVWMSHTTDIGQDEDVFEDGPAFDNKHELLSLLEVGDVIGVRVCARFAGWEHYAHDGRLVVRTSTQGHIAPDTSTDTNWKAIIKDNKKLQDASQKYLNAATPEEAPPAYSVEAALLTSPLRVDSTYGAGERPLRLLSLDGGGVRGISELHILKEIEQTMIKLTGNANTKPCEYFDMIAGTSTGGLVAIMLGRLRMSITECIAAYEQMAKRIFDRNEILKKGSLALTGAQFDHVQLEKAVKEIVQKYTGNPDAEMYDSRDNACKVFVLAVRANNTTNMTATYFRTYTNPRVVDPFARYPIWQAARATSAAPAYFARMKIGDWEYVDGGMGFNNPVIMLMIESRLCFGYARPLDCLLTIGTGVSPNVSLGSESAIGTIKVLPAMIDIVTNGERAHFQASQLAPEGTYYRFNAGERITEVIKTKEGKNLTLENWADKIISLDDWDKMAQFVTFTQEYLSKEKPRVQECAQKLTGGA